MERKNVDHVQAQSHKNTQGAKFVIVAFLVLPISLKEGFINKVMNF